MGQTLSIAVKMDYEPATCQRCQKPLGFGDTLYQLTGGPPVYCSRHCLTGDNHVEPRDAATAAGDVSFVL